MNRTSLMSLLLTVVLGTMLVGCKSKEVDPESPIADQGDGRFLPRVRIPRVHKIAIQQGNVITQDMVDRLRPGMTRRQVLFVLGQAVLANSFREDSWDYVYTFKPGYGETLTQKLTVHFEGDLLSSFEGDFEATAFDSISGDERETSDGAEVEAVESALNEVSDDADDEAVIEGSLEDLDSAPDENPTATPTPT